MKVQQFDYPQWLSAVRTRLGALRPDVTVEDLDPNACMRAFRAGHSAHDFASLAVLPLKPPAPTPPTGPLSGKSNALVRSRAPASRGRALLSVLGLLVGLGCLAVFLMSRGVSDTPETKRMRSVAQAVAATYANDGLFGAVTLHPGVWFVEPALAITLDGEYVGLARQMTEAEAGTRPDFRLPLKIASPSVGKITFGGGYGEAEIDCVGDMANGTKQPGKLSLQYDLVQERVGIVLFKPSK